MTATETSNLLSAELVSRYAALIYQKTGITISPKKTALLSNRLRRRLRGTNIPTFEAYYDHLRRLRSNDPEWDRFLQEITTHETYLFRDENQWEWFRTVYLPELHRQLPCRPRELRIWSAAASTGDEATTIACCVLDCLPQADRWRVQILGTDIGIGALEMARRAAYGERAMRLVPDTYRRRFFTKDPQSELWHAKPDVKKLITYRQHNLIEPLREKPFDVVFLKNVLIYFDAASKRTVIGHLRSVMRPGSLLIAGGAEGISDLVSDFDRLSPWLFRFPTSR